MKKTKRRKFFEKCLKGMKIMSFINLLLFVKRSPDGVKESENVLARGTKIQKRSLRA